MSDDHSTELTVDAAVNGNIASASEESRQPGRTDSSTDASEIISLKGQIERLTQRVDALIAERDSYRRAAMAWAAAQITDADIERYAREEPGLPLESFID